MNSLEIYVNQQLVDILNRSSINLRLNNQVYNPTEVNTKQAEYSFSFNLPTTPTNNKIFGYANELAKINKFRMTYPTEVYSDGHLIFSGQLRIQSIQKGFYNVNLVNIKINTLEDIFGEMTLNQLNWSIPFNVVDTINALNLDSDSKIFFPLISYGAFQKEPKSTEYDYNIYTSKFQIDKTNKWYYESFYPSINLLELIVRFFNQKGYTVKGNIFNDNIINSLYTSINLEDKQYPVYNLANPLLGSASIRCQFSNYLNKNTGEQREAQYLQHNLSFPYLPIGDEYNFNSVSIYDLWSEDNSLVTSNNKSFLYNEGENCIVIPADGLYKIRLTTKGRLPDQTVKTYEYKVLTGEVMYWPVTLNTELQRDMPIEIQLVRNTNECELIKGSYQWTYKDGDRSNEKNWLCAYPHENLYSNLNPSEANARYTRGGNIDRRAFNDFNEDRKHRTGNFGGYIPKPGELLAFDPYVNENFICGFSTMSSGTHSVIKNGYSWNDSTENNSRYNTSGYWRIDYTGRGTEQEATYIKTEFNKCDLTDATQSFSISNQTFNSYLECIVELKRNDILVLKALIRDWYQAIYKIDLDVTVEIEAYSPKDINSIEAEGRSFTSPSQFDKDLNLGQFLNNKTKVSDFIQNFINEFNLSFINEGKQIYLDTQYLGIDKQVYALNLDNRVQESESSLIDYPNSLQVKYKIDTEEWGFEKSVPPDKINENNWADYGDYQSDKIIFNSDQTDQSVQLDTSYCWYDTFKLLNQSDEEIGSIDIPVISKYSYMIDGYSYEKSMQVDGKGQAMRYWFKDRLTDYTVLVNGKYPVNIYLVTNQKDNTPLNYKSDGLLGRYFNISNNLSFNYVTIKVYLNADEYLLLKNGAKVIFDSDIYLVSEISGWDAMGLNQTELKLIKYGN